MQNCRIWHGSGNCRIKSLIQKWTEFRGMDGENVHVLLLYTSKWSTESRLKAVQEIDNALQQKAQSFHHLACEVQELPVEHLHWN